MISHDARTSNSYLISPNKRHFEALRCDAYGRATLKNGRRDDAYFDSNYNGAMLINGRRFFQDRRLLEKLRKLECGNFKRKTSRILRNAPFSYEKIH